MPVIHTDCAFGQWYYGDGQDLDSMNTFREIEEPHERLHEAYMRIFKAMSEEELEKLV